LPRSLHSIVGSCMLHRETLLDKPFEFQTFWNITFLDSVSLLPAISMFRVLRFYFTFQLKSETPHMETSELEMRSLPVL
jgi:hypothetical protein